MVTYQVHIPELRRARWERRIPAARLAAQLGVSLGWYRIVERDPALASPELLRRIGEALGVDAAALLGPRIVAGKIV